VTKKLEARKIAFLGSATSSRSLAPFDDPEWEVWATGPGCHNDPAFKSQFERWFEFHDMVDNDPQYGAVIDPGYFEWLAMIGKEKQVYYRPPIYPGLTGIEFPWDELKDKHCGYFLDSTVAWMMAFALEYENPPEIGLWGIDFATDAERMKQRKGTKHFMELFKHKGIPCFVPDVSDMSFDPPPYPSASKLGIKIDNQLSLIIPERQKVEQTLKNLEDQIPATREYLERVKGTIQTLEYFKENWS